GTRLHGQGDLSDVVLGDAEYNLRRGAADISAQQHEEFQTAHDRHLRVEEDGIGHLLPALVESLLPILGLFDNVVHILKDTPRYFADDTGIIDDETGLHSKDPFFSGRPWTLVTDNSARLPTNGYHCLALCRRSALAPVPMRGTMLFIANTQPAAGCLPWMPAATARRATCSRTAVLSWRGCNSARSASGGGRSTATPSNGVRISKRWTTCRWAHSPAPWPAYSATSSRT